MFVVALEILSFIGLAMFFRTLHVFPRTGELLRAVEINPFIQLSSKEYRQELIAVKKPVVLHPYLGYVRNQKSFNATGTGDESLQPYGFGDTSGTLVRSDDPSIVVVGIFGGSVAALLSHDQESLDMLANSIQAMPKFKGKKVIFTVGALGGYKQPQSLLAYNYLLTLGARFDVVLVIDGFNEVALGIAENVPKKVNPGFPRGWYFSSVQSDPSMMGDFFGIPTQRWIFAKMMQSRIIRWSPTSRLVWLVTDLVFERKISQFEIESKKSKSTPGYAVSGPVLPEMESGAILAMQVDLWKESTRQMSRLAKANGALFINVLQPNQYIPNGKPMGDEESRIAISERTVHPELVVDGYPLLREAATSLRAEGVTVFDLSMAFERHAEPLYYDDCCHFSADGYHILIKMLDEKLQEMHQ